MLLSRHHAAAFVVAMLAALVGNGALQLALDAVRVSGRGSGVPWWITAELIGRGRWVVCAGLLYLAAPVLLTSSRTATAESPGQRSAAWQQVGLAVLVVPLLWVGATWVVSALRFTLLGSWSTEGLVFLSPGYYRGLVLDYVPWLIGGATILMVRRHV